MFHAVQNVRTVTGDAGHEVVGVLAPIKGSLRTFNRLLLFVQSGAALVKQRRRLLCPCLGR